MQTFDAVIIGAGAAGLFCAGIAGQMGLNILLLDHSPRVAEKIRISGGGRCNFTNLDTSPHQFLSDNPRFARSALAGFTPRDFVQLMQRHQIAHHEKHKGQLFCDHSSQDIIQMLLRECDAGSVTRWQPCEARAIRHGSHSTLANGQSAYEIDTDRGTVACSALVIATGGLSIPKIGATDFGYRIARQFEIPLVPTRPALVPLCFEPATWAPFAALSGLSLPVHIATAEKKQNISFTEDLLITHRGISGPGALQISSYWHPNTAIQINLMPGLELANLLFERKAASKKQVAKELATLLPARLADLWASRGPTYGQDWSRAINETTDKSLQALAQALSRWELRPEGTEGYHKAEVTAGGVDTRALSSQTMESRQPGLYFIGEVVDVTGWLGGYNFQWAWSSAYACAKGLKSRSASGMPAMPLPCV